MLRHEQQSIRMALATVMHHSYKVHTENGAPRSQTTATRAREGEVHGQHDGLRAQNRPLPGTRPEPLVEVSEPQGRSVTWLPGLLSSGGVRNCWPTRLPRPSMVGPSGTSSQGEPCPEEGGRGGGGEEEDTAGDVAVAAAWPARWCCLFVPLGEEEEEEEEQEKAPEGSSSPLWASL